MAPQLDEEIVMAAEDIIWCVGMLIALILAVLYVAKQILNALDDMEGLNKQIDEIVKKHTEKKQHEINKGGVVYD